MLVVIVVVINVLLATYGFYLAWQIWRLRQALSRAADALTAAEHSAAQVLQGAPEAILKGEIGTQELRSRYQDLQPKLRQAQQALTLLRLSQRVLGGRSRMVKVPTLIKRMRTSRK
jgi:uncharacterized membrane protein YccC